MKNFLQFHIMCVLLAGLIIGVNCFADEFTIIPQVGYSNLQREGSWNIVSVEVNNPGSSVSGTLEVRTGSAGQNIVSRDIAIGKGKFLYHLYYYCNSPWEVKVAVRDGRRDIVDPLELLPTDLGPDSYICLVVGGMPGLGRLRTGRLGDFQIAYIKDTTRMPDSWVGYDLADFLLFSDSDLSRLEPEQENAVRDWVRRGGRIGIAAGKNWQYIRDSFLDDILPFDITGTKEAPSTEVFNCLSIRGGSPERNITIATVDNCPDDLAIWSVSETPVAIRFRYGKGEVLFFAVDPGDEVFRGLGDIVSFWERTLGVREAEFESAHSQNEYSVYSALSSIQQNLASIEGARQIPLGVFVLIFVIYIAVIGPVDYFLLKKLRKLSLTHLTFIFYVLIFSVFAYYYTFRMKGGDMWINKFIVADLPSEGDYDYVTGTTTMMVFSPQKNTYVIPFTSSTALRTAPIDEYMSFRSTREVKGCRTYQSDSGNELHVPIPIWTHQFINAEWALPSPGNVDCSLRVSSRSVTGSIQNNLGFRVEEATLLYGDGMLSLGPIPDNQNILIDDHLSSTWTRQHFGTSYGSLDSSALFMTAPELSISKVYGDDSAKELIMKFKELRKSSLDHILNEKDKGILILKCNNFDDGLGIRGWDSAKKESHVYFRKICDIEF